MTINRVDEEQECKKFSEFWLNKTGAKPVLWHEMFEKYDMPKLSNLEGMYYTREQQSAWEAWWCSANTSVNQELIRDQS